MSLPVIEPVSTASNWMRRILFEPFDLAKWMTLGFCCWLAQLGESKGGSFKVPGGGGRGPFGGGAPWSGAPDLRQGLDWVQDHLPLILGLVAGVVLFAMALGLLLLWISSRGKMLFVEGVIRNHPAVVEPWGRLVHLGNSLMWFRVVVGLIGFLLFGGLLAAAALLALPAIRADDWSGLILPVVGLVGVGLLIALPLMVIGVLLDDFVVPVMWLRNVPVMEAWREIRAVLLDPHLGSVVLYLLFKVVLSIGAGILVAVATCLTCCLAALPYIGTVILLPIHVFFRCWSLAFLAQVGGDYRRLLGETVSPAVSG